MFGQSLGNTNVSSLRPPVRTKGVLMQFSFLRNSNFSSNFSTSSRTSKCSSNCSSSSNSNNSNSPRLASHKQIPTPNWEVHYGSPEA